MTSPVLPAADGHTAPGAASGRSYPARRATGNRDRHRCQPAASDAAFDAATSIGCGACVAACPNGSAALFLGAKITFLGLLPQGQPARNSRSMAMIDQHDAEGFGGCTQIGECTAVCRKGIHLDVISRYHRDVIKALLHGET